MSELLEPIREQFALLPFAVRAIGPYGQDVLCTTVNAIGPAQALGQVLAANLMSQVQSTARCWVVTRL